MSQSRVSRVILVVGVLALLPIRAQAQRREEGRRGGGEGWQARYDRWIEGYLERITDAYALTEAEQKLVQTELEHLRDRNERYAEQRRDRFRELGGEMRELWQARQNGQPVDEERMNAIRDELRQMWTNAPLSPDNVLRQVEALLPPEKVKNGRARWDAMANEWRSRWGDRGGRTDSWQRHVDRFCDQYRLDDAQRATAQAVLEDCMRRRDRLREASQREMTALREIEDREARMQRFRGLRAPEEVLYQELQARLESIPTSTQRLAAPQPETAPATQPTSRPFERLREREGRGGSAGR